VADPVKVRLETEHLSLGVIALHGISLPKEYTPPEPPSAPDGEIAVARAMYRAIGQDPTRNRPSSEALYRRLKKGLGFPRVNALVDALNVCSVTLLLPFGCYDLDRIEGDVVCRVGAEGEGFEGVGNRHVNVSGRYTVADARGPFGNPSMDSMRTSITPACTNALVTVFAPPDYGHDRLPWVVEVLTTVVGGTASTEVLTFRPWGGM
jgi:DNA/RNA-binding domain of Phe-tRNA-synthetase-like protein